MACGENSQPGPCANIHKWRHANRVREGALKFVTLWMKLFLKQSFLCDKRKMEPRNSPNLRDVIYEWLLIRIFPPTTKALNHSIYRSTSISTGNMSAMFRGPNRTVLFKKQIWKILEFARYSEHRTCEYCFEFRALYNEYIFWRKLAFIAKQIFVEKLKNLNKKILCMKCSFVNDNKE